MHNPSIKNFNRTIKNNWWCKYVLGAKVQASIRDVTYGVLKMKPAQAQSALTNKMKENATIRRLLLKIGTDRLGADIAELSQFIARASKWKLGLFGHQLVNEEFKLMTLKKAQQYRLALFDEQLNEHLPSRSRFSYNPVKADIFTDKERDMLMDYLENAYAEEDSFSNTMSI